MTNQTQTTRQPQRQANGRAAGSPPQPPPQPATPPIQTMGAPAGQAPLNPAPSIQVYTESPASMNLRFDYRGANLQLTLREGSGTALLDKLDAVLDRLERMGATLNATAARPSPVAPAGTPQCPDGHGPMKESTKKPGTYFCPHVIAESAGKKIYCQQKSG